MPPSKHNATHYNLLKSNEEEVFYIFQPEKKKVTPRHNMAIVLDFWNCSYMSYNL